MSKARALEVAWQKKKIKPHSISNGNDMKMHLTVHRNGPMNGLMGPTWRIPVRHRWSSGACGRCWSVVPDLPSVGNSCPSGAKKAQIPLIESVPE